jgi:phospholipid-binding lipoprotein MlaA
MPPNKRTTGTVKTSIRNFIKTAALILSVCFLILAGCATQKATEEATAKNDLSQSSNLPQAASAATIEPAPGDRASDDTLLKSDPLADDPLMDDPLKDEFDALEDEGSMYTVADPLEPFNRAMFALNDKLYFWVLKPVAKGYRTVTPQPVRSGISNFFHNLLAPVRLVNNILQGKGQAAEAELAKFLYNSTVGVLGFGNPAKKHPALNPDPEDLGQTLGSYGIGDGFYVVWPVLGASTLRDTVGDVADGFLNPVSYVDPFEAYLTLQGLDTVNTLSFRIGDYETLKKAALDPYQALRNAYTQLRQSKIKK